MFDQSGACLIYLLATTYITSYYVTSDATYKTYIVVSQSNKYATSYNVFEHSCLISMKMATR